MPASSADSSRSAETAAMSLAQVGVVVPARDEAAGIAETVTALRAIPGVAAVVVVDDGSAGRHR